MDYAEDLRSYDARDVRLACAQWRSGESNRMPTPGELIGKCRNLVKPWILERSSRRIEALPERTFSDEHKAKMQAEMRALVADLAAAKQRRGQIERKPGETDAAQAERLWPSHRADRIAE